MLRSQDQHEALQQQRAAQARPAYAAQYRTRAGIEGTLSQGVRAFDLRESRYVGLAKTDVQMMAIATAMNLERCGGMRAGFLPVHSRVTPFAALAHV
jgi:transposase